MTGVESMKKIVSLLFCVLFFVSCKSSDMDDPADINSNDRPFAVETMQKIIMAFDDEDSEALYEMFSDAAKENNDIKSQIDEAMQYYKGNSVVSCSDVSHFFTGSAGIKDNVYSFKSIRFMLFDWETDVGETYSFDIIYVRVDEEDPSQIGLAKIYFKDPEDNNGYVLAIGDDLE